MKRRILIACAVLAMVFASAQDYNIPFRPRTAAATRPSVTGSTLEFSGTTSNTGTASTTITVPADATFVVVGITGYHAVADYYSGGGMTFTKGGADTAMTVAITGANSGDHSSTSMMTAMYYLVAPDTGSNKTLKWDWSGTDTGDTPKISVIFLKGVHQTTPVRGTGGGQSGSSTPYTTSSFTTATTDLLVVWAGGYPSDPVEGSCDSWSATGSSATLLSQTTYIFENSDGAWATGVPTGTSTTATCATDTLWDDGAIVAISVEPL